MTMGQGAFDILRAATAGRVTTLFCPDVALGRAQVRAAAEEMEPLPTLVTLEWATAPSLAHELDEIRDALAKGALDLWPHWYLSAEGRFTEEMGRLTANRAEFFPSVGEAVLGASASWLKKAGRLCEAGRLPVVLSMPSAAQVRQLALALDPNRLILALSVLDEAASPTRIKALAHAAEWLATESRAKTLLLVPGTWSGKRELDHVNYGAAVLERDELQAPPRMPESSNAPSKEAAERSFHSDGTPLQVVVGPFTGKPHPASEVEQTVYQEMIADPELRDLFEYNQPLTSFGGKSFIVDLLWRQGRLIVELDGPEHHGHMAYVRDRDRDYRFLMDGYRTLRIPNAEVYADVARVVDKIRNVVRKLTPRTEGAAES